MRGVLIFKRIAVVCSAILLQTNFLIAQTAEQPKLSKQYKLIYDMVSSMPELEKIGVADTTTLQNNDSCWIRGVFLQLGFSQLSLTNWAAGGFSSVALNTYVDIYADYTEGNLLWENRLQFAYGFLKSFGEGYKKSDDKFIADTKVGYLIDKNLYASSFLNVRTQMTNGYVYPKKGDPELVSTIISPAYISLGVGIDYKPIKSLSINFSPLTSGATIVVAKSLREKYGNREDQPVMLILGARFNMEYKGHINDNLSVETALSLFSDYLHKPKNIKVNWDFSLNAQVTKYISFNIRTNLIYDDVILIEDKDGIVAPRVQFKEILSIGFAYTFGQQKDVKR